jgi:hypothetical protein
MEPRIELTLLVRAYCHLCDEMRDALMPLAKAAGAHVTEIDVDADAGVEARFGDLVPVLLLGGIDGAELCHYRLDAARVADSMTAAQQALR